MNLICSHSTAHTIVAIVAQSLWVGVSPFLLFLTVSHAPRRIGNHGQTPAFVGVNRTVLFSDFVCFILFSSEPFQTVVSRPRPNSHRTRDATRMQIETFFLWFCLRAVWALPFTSTGPISFASRRASCVDWVQNYNHNLIRDGKLAQNSDSQMLFVAILRHFFRFWAFPRWMLLGIHSYIQCREPSSCMKSAREVEFGSAPWSRVATSPGMLLTCRQVPCWSLTSPMAS